MEPNKHEIHKRHRENMGWQLEANYGKEEMQKRLTSEKRREFTAGKHKIILPSGHEVEVEKKGNTWLIRTSKGEMKLNENTTYIIGRKEIIAMPTTWDNTALVRTIHEYEGDNRNSRVQGMFYVHNGKLYLHDVGSLGKLSVEKPIRSYFEEIIPDRYKKEIQDGKRERKIQKIEKGKIEIKLPNGTTMKLEKKGENWFIGNAKIENLGLIVKRDGLYATNGEKEWKLAEIKGGKIQNLSSVQALIFVNENRELEIHDIGANKMEIQSAEEREVEKMETELFEELKEVEKLRKELRNGLNDKRVVELARKSVESLLSNKDEIVKLLDKNPSVVEEYEKPDRVIVQGDVGGDIEKALSAINEFLKQKKEGKKTALVFIGDILDARTGVEQDLSPIILDLIFKLKAKYPDEVHLLRGNHDDPYPKSPVTFESALAKILLQGAPKGAESEIKQIGMRIENPQEWEQIKKFINQQVAEYIEQNKENVIKFLRASSEIYEILSHTPAIVRMGDAVFVHAFFEPEDYDLLKKQNKGTQLKQSEFQGRAATTPLARCLWSRKIYNIVNRSGTMDESEYLSKGIKYIIKGHDHVVGHLIIDQGKTEFERNGFKNLSKKGLHIINYDLENTGIRSKEPIVIDFKNKKVISKI